MLRHLHGSNFPSPTPRRPLHSESNEIEIRTPRLVNALQNATILLETLTQRTSGGAGASKRSAETSIADSGRDSAARLTRNRHA